MLGLDFTSIIAVVLKWSATQGVKVVIILVVAYVGLKIAHKLTHRLVAQLVQRTYRHGNAVAQEKRIDTLHAIIISALRVVVWVVVGLIILSEIGIDIGPLLAAAGIAGIAVGFGAQYLVKDIISGLFIILEDQYRKGDVVKIAGVAGLVEDITLRDTVLRDIDGVQHYVPNGSIEVASNLTKLWSRAHLKIGVSYDADLEKTMDILNTIGKEMAEDSSWQDKIVKPLEALGVDDFADSAVVIKVLGETKPSEQWAVMREYRKRVKIAFDKAGLEIPFPQQTVHLKKEK